MANVTVEVSDGIATVLITRPPVNALDAPTFRELTDIFRGFAHTQDASVVILSAPGDRIFCGGVDLKDGARRRARQTVPGDTTADLVDSGALPRNCFEAIRHCAVPVIGAINGVCIGAGVSIAACCDILVASDTASLSTPEIKVGVLGGGRHLQRLVGPLKARTAFFTGEPIPATELYRLGVVEAVVPPAELMATARAIAAKVARHSPIGLRLGKESLNRVEDLPLEQGYRIEQDYTLRVSTYNDSTEARTAALEKRDPKWIWT